jgi:hypothetical protein
MQRNNKIKLRRTSFRNTAHHLIYLSEDVPFIVLLFAPSPRTLTLKIHCEVEGFSTFPEASILHPLSR